jgi:hypothetical protein
MKTRVLPSSVTICGGRNRGDQDRRQAVYERKQRFGVAGQKEYRAYAS